MKTNPSNTWLMQSGKSQIEFYTSAKDVIIIERKRTTKLLVDLFHYHFQDRTRLKILDLGCGDGAMIFQLQESYPDNEFYLMDGSKNMLAKAKEKITGAHVFFLNQSFEEYMGAEPEPLKYQFIFSSNAIHHLDFFGKSQLYGKIFRELDFGGLFLNIDVVLPPTERCEQWEFTMWVDWMNETLENNGLKEDIGKYDNLPNIYKFKPENKPSGLFEQLEVLRQIGFRDVECFYKYGIFALFGGTKK